MCFILLNSKNMQAYFKQIKQTEQFLTMHVWCFEIHYLFKTPHKLLFLFLTALRAYQYLFH